MTTRTGGALAGVVRFGIVERLHRNLPKTMIEGKMPTLQLNEESETGNLPQNERLTYDRGYPLM